MKAFNITSLPTILLFKDNQIRRYEKEEIDNYIAKNAPQAIEEN